jgi:hypothetical protein
MSGEAVDASAYYLRVDAFARAARFIRLGNGLAVCRARWPTGGEGNNHNDGRQGEAPGNDGRPCIACVYERVERRHDQSNDHSDREKRGWPIKTASSQEEHFDQGNNERRIAGSDTDGHQPIGEIGPRYVGCSPISKVGRERSNEARDCKSQEQWVKSFPAIWGEVETGHVGTTEQF